MPKRPYPRWQRRHEPVLQWILAHPNGKLAECAAATGYTPSQVSRIARSPDFIDRLEAALDSARIDAAERGRLNIRLSRRRPRDEPPPIA